MFPQLTAEQQATVAREVLQAALARASVSSSPAIPSRIGRGRGTGVNGHCDIDRLTTLYVVRPTCGRSFTDKVSIPILMYHSIADEDENGRTPVLSNVHSPRRVRGPNEKPSRRGFLGYRCRRGHPPIEGAKRDETRWSSLLTTATAISTPMPSRSFFAYGFSCDNVLAYGARRAKHSYTLRERMSDWNEVRELQKHGIGFGSHTVTHPQLQRPGHAFHQGRDCGVQANDRENLGCPVSHFRILMRSLKLTTLSKAKLKDDLLQRAGYENGVCTTVGRSFLNSDPFFLDRLPVNSDDDPRLFQAKLAGSYDWIAKPQYIVKVAKSPLRRSSKAARPHSTAVTQLQRSDRNLKSGHVLLTRSPLSYTGYKED